MVLRAMNSVFTRHGRWLFAIITLVIIVSFVGFLTPGFTSLLGGATIGGGSSGATVGTAFGKKVSVTDLRDQARHGMFFMYLLSGGMFTNSQLYDYAEGEAFNQLCQLAAAKNRGIVVSDAEVAEFIEKLPMFQSKDGQFEVEKYRKFCQNFLTPNGATEEDLAEAIRNGLILGKLYQQVIGGVLVTNDELKRFYQELYEKFDVYTATFKPDVWLAQVKVTPAELQSYFNAHRKEYNTPAQFKVKVVAFEYANFEKTLAVPATDAALKKYYEQNKKTFEVKHGDQLVVPPLAQIKDTVRRHYRLDLAKAVARNQAQQFATDVYKKIAEDDKNRIKYFSELAATRQLPISDLGWISSASAPDAVLGEPTLLDEITKIYIQIPISNPVIGEKAIYVALLEDKKDSRPATLDEVKAQVVKVVREQKAVTMAREKARNAAAVLSKAEDKLAAFKKLAGMAEVKHLEPFIAMNPPYGPTGNLIAGLADATPVGTVSQVQDLPTGALLVFVAKRTAPLAKDFSDALPMVVARYQNLKQEMAKQNFSRWIQLNCQNYQVKGNQ